MGPDPFNMPGFGGAQNFGSFAQQDIAQAAPLATEWHGTQGAIAGASIPQFANISNPKQATQNFWQKLGQIASEGYHVAGNVAGLVTHGLEDMVSSPVHYTQGIYRGVNDRLTSDRIQAQTGHLSDSLNNLHNLYKSGRISKNDYVTGLQDLGKQFSSLSSQAKGLDNRTKIDQQNAFKSTIDLSSAVLTVVSGGTSLLTRGGTALVGDAGVQAAGNFLKSSASNLAFTSLESTMQRVVADKTIADALTTPALNAVLKSTAEATAGAGTQAAAGQIARSAAVNLAFKYPLTFSALSSTGNQIYSQLDNRKYGDAVRTAAFNALLLTAGGPIGHALKYGGSAAKGAVFGKTSFWDELSKYYGDGSTDGFARAVDKLASNMHPEDAKQFVKNLGAVEATNVGAVGGEATAAAMRVAEGMKNAYGFDLSQVSHEQALQDMVNFAKNQRLADEAGKANGLGAVTVGRLDARDLNRIAAALTGQDVKAVGFQNFPTVATASAEDRLKAWQTFKEMNPSQAFANNANFDKQITRLINTHEDPVDLHNAIRGIRTAFSVKGFPEDIAKQMAKDGYIPIQPVKLEAPFKEGSAQFSTHFPGQQDFFTKTVAPLPILGHIGDALTSMGLSPDASSRLVFQTFNNNLERNLSETGVLGSDNPKGLIQVLSDYAKQPTRGGININGQSVRPPITDLRQLTNKDIQAALQVSASDAQKVQESIGSAMLQVPLDIRGMGDRLVDYARQLPGFNRYLSTQGAARFAWNPFFKIKLAAKTESLSQLESGGKLLTVPGTNTMIRAIAPDTYKNIESTRAALRSAGVFEEKGLAGFGGGEGAIGSEGAIANANLGHHLLPSQERSISSLVVAQSKKAGLSPEEFIHTSPQEVRDTVQAIVGYDRNANFLNSPLARTLNYAFFPFRFNVKVAGFMAKALSRTDTLTQFAVLHGLYNGSQFLNSPAGQAWYAKNSDVIQFMKYFTPLETMSSVVRILGQQPHSIGDFGELGGLPFGWIPQLLDAEGLTHFGAAPYVSPKTGDTVAQYIPLDARGRLSAAIMDLVGALYTYPGATVGLPSKTKIDSGIGNFFTGASTASDFSKVQPPIPSGLQSFSDAVKSTQPQQPVPPPGTITKQAPLNQQATPNPQPNVMAPETNVPRGVSPVDTTQGKIPKAKKSSTKGLNADGSKKLKKGQFTPALLPGQSSLGQL
jgi:hypothetical protein